MRCTALGADEKIIPSVLEYVGLVDTGKKKARNFSLGMRQRLGIAAALEDSLTQFYAAFEERGISPSIDIPQNEVVRIADKDALARVFGNVISNAVRYSDGDFCVTMKENGHLRKRGVLARRGEREAPVRPLFYGGKRARLRGIGAFHR